MTDQARAIIAQVTSPSGRAGSVGIDDGDKPASRETQLTRQYDSWDGANAASEDWVGYTFSTPQTFNRVAFQEGMHFFDGGRFPTLTVQVRQNGQWIGVSNLSVKPAYGEQ